MSDLFSFEHHLHLRWVSKEVMALHVGLNMADYSYFCDYYNYYYYCRCCCCC